MVESISSRTSDFNHTPKSGSSEEYDGGLFRLFVVKELWSLVEWSAQQTQASRTLMSSEH